MFVNKVFQITFVVQFWYLFRHFTQINKLEDFLTIIWDSIIALDQQFELL